MLETMKSQLRKLRYETRPAEVDDCVVAVNESGTGSTIEMIIDGKRVEVVKNDLGSDKPVGQTPSQDTRLFTDGARNPFTRTHSQMLKV